jgi:hypothetical protein
MRYQKFGVLNAKAAENPWHANRQHCLQGRYLSQDIPEAAIRYSARIEVISQESFTDETRPSMSYDATPKMYVLLT